MNTDYIAWRSILGGVLDTRYYTLKWLDSRVMDGSALVWATPNAIILAEIKCYPTGALDIHGLIAAGDVADIVEKLIPKAIAFGQDNGCLAAIVESRNGWERALAKSGFSRYQVSVRKPIG